MPEPGPRLSRLAGSTHGAHIADYLADLATTHGRVKLAERMVGPDQHGKSLKEVSEGIGVRVYRAGKPYGFWEPEVDLLIPGDVIVEILPTSAMERQAG